MPFFSSQTLRAARSNVLVRESVPTAGRIISSSSTDSLLRRRLAALVRVLERGRTAASLFSKWPVGLSGVIVSRGKSSFPASVWEPARKSACASPVLRRLHPRHGESKTRLPEHFLVRGALRERAGKFHPRGRRFSADGRSGGRGGSPSSIP